MSDLQFNTGTDEFGRPKTKGHQIDIADRLVAWGLVGNRQTAIYTLIGIGVLSLIGAIVMFSGGGSGAPPLLPQ